MPNIEVLEQWDDIYQLETTDPVQGGEDGIDNLPHKNLANRTLWLKNKKAEKAGDGSQKFKVADGIADDDAVNKKQLDKKAEKAGDGSQKFKVADAIADDDAVNKKQVLDLFSSFQPFPIGYTMLSNNIYDFTLVEFGGEFSRALYPKLWAFIQSHPELTKTDSQWQTENTANGMCGFFSTGNGSTTFRVRNMAEAFERASNRGIGTYQADDFRSHTHMVNGTIYAYASVASGVGRDFLPASVESVAAGGIETRPKNIAKLPLIVYK
jgi:hypothetical protein